MKPCTVLVPAVVCCCALVALLHAGHDFFAYDSSHLEAAVAPLPHRVRIVLPSTTDDMTWLESVPAGIEVFLYRHEVARSLRGPAEISSQVQLQDAAGIATDQPAPAMLHHIVTNYNDLAEWTVFSATSYINGTSRILAHLSSISFGANGETKASCLSCPSPCESGPLELASPQQSDLDVVVDMAGLEKESLRICPGGLVAAHKDAIRKHPIALYKQLFQEYFVPQSAAGEDDHDDWHCAGCAARAGAEALYAQLWLPLFSAKAAPAPATNPMQLQEPDQQEHEESPVFAEAPVVASDDLAVQGESPVLEAEGLADILLRHPLLDGDEDKGFLFLFNGCCRGDALKNRVNMGERSREECQALCLAQHQCVAVEVNGCAASKDCVGACWHFHGTTSANISNGGCDTTGNQKCYGRRDRLMEEAEVLPRWRLADTATGPAAVQVVVARYAEDVSWLSHVSEEVDIALVNKGTPPTPVAHSRLHLERLGNAKDGREAHTFLFHIIKNYDNLANWTIFTQANPFPHSPTFVDVVNRFSMNLPDPGRPVCLSCQYLPGWTPGCDSQGTPKEYPIHSSSLQLTDPALFDSGVANFMAMHGSSESMESEAVVAKLMKTVGLTRPDSEVAFCYGALFAVHKSMIQQHPKRAYEALMKEYFQSELDGPSPEKWDCEDCVAKPMAGYIYERLWMHIFSADSLSLSKARAAKAERKACRKQCTEAVDRRSCKAACLARTRIP